MAKLMLSNEAPVYVEYNLSETEQRIEDLLGEIGLKLEPRILSCKGTDTRGGRFPNNFGYDVNIVNDERYFGVGVWYGRWGNITSEVSLERALQQLAEDSLVYQYLAFPLDLDPLGKNSVEFEVYRLDPVDVSVTRDHPKTQAIRQSFIAKYPQSYLIINPDHQGIEFSQFDVPLADLCETVIEIVKPMKY